MPLREASPASRKNSQDARDQHAPGGRVAGARKERGQRQRHHHRQIEEDRRRGGTGEAVHDVEHAAIERHQRDQQQVGKGDPRQRDREFAAGRVVGEARREDADHLRHEQPRHHQQHHLRGEQQREDAVGEHFCRGFALAVNMRIGRHERGVERAFGKDRAEMIGQPQRHEERVRHRTGAEDRREHDVARKTGQPREKRIAADGEDAPKHAPLLQHAAMLQKCFRTVFSRNATVFAHPLTLARFRRVALKSGRKRAAHSLMTRSCVDSSR